MQGVPFRNVGFGVIFAGFLAAATPAGAADQDLVAKGAYLARMGDCQACHSKVGGQPYAGGDPIKTPFGSIYPPNITSDVDYGIGGWTDAEFLASLHDGLGKGGKYLYPAMPYQWYTKVTHEDVEAIRAFMATVPAVHVPSHPNDLMFPFNVRSGLGAWNAAFFKAGYFKPDTTKSDEFNRGAYLVQGLGHCGDCHTPKGLAMEPVSSKAFSGGMIDKWYAPNITSNAGEGIGAWSVDDLTHFLKGGTDPGKGVVLGPMAQVVHDSLSKMSDSDVRAIAVFLKSTVPLTSYKDAQPAAATGPQAVGAESYLNHCASCHQLNGKGLSGAVPALDTNGAVLAKGPENVIRVILSGALAQGTYAPMPALGYGMTSQEIADATNYVRTSWSNGAPASASEGMVGDIRKDTFSMLEGQGAPDGKRNPCESEEALLVPALKDPQQDIAKTLAKVDAGTMQQAAVTTVAMARKLDPKAAQADIVNGLTVAYCRVLTQEPGGLVDGNRRDLLNRFSQLVYTQYVDPEKN